MTVSALALIPVLLGVAIAVVTITVTLRRLTEARSMCLRQTSQLSTELGRHLKRLLALNGRARALRRSLAVARKARAAARLLGPEAVAAAEAVVRAIELGRAALAAQQRAILARAELARMRHHRTFVQDAKELRASPGRMHFESLRALAVRPRPREDFAPEFIPVENFERRQRATGSLVVKIASPARDILRAEHEVVCAVTLRKEGRNWKPRMLADSAPPNWRSSPSR